MLSRRSFLIGAGTVALTQLLSGCGDRSAALQVLLLQGSIPPQLLKAFRQQLATPVSLSFKPEAQLQGLWDKLQSWQDKTPNSQGLKALLRQLPIINQQSGQTGDLVTLGDAWLARAIQDQLIQPLPLTEVDSWQKLPPRWQRLVQRDQTGNLDEQGLIWGAPYRWGTTLIAYRKDKFAPLGWTPRDWSDLWREDLRDRLALIDQPREIIGLTLKKLGYSYNTQDLNSIPDLASELKALNQQTKYYSSKFYLQPLIIGDVWVSVGWSSDILPLVANNRQIGAIVPQSGTAIWNDIWVKPKTEKEESQLSELARQWIAFCWQEQSTEQISLLTNAISPMIYQTPKIPPEISKNPLLLIDQTILNRSDFIEPLPPESQQKYEEFWKAMRTSSTIPKS